MLSTPTLIVPVREDAEQETVDIGALFNLLVDGSPDPVSGVRTGAQQNGMIGTARRLQPRSHLPRLHRVYPVIDCRRSVVVAATGNSSRARDGRFWSTCLLGQYVGIRRRACVLVGRCRFNLAVSWPTSTC